MQPDNVLFDACFSEHQTTTHQYQKTYENLPFPAVIPAKQACSGHPALDLSEHCSCASQACASTQQPAYRYQALFQCAPVACAVINAAGAIIEANAAFLRLFELNDGRIPHMSLFDYCDDPDAFLHHLDTLLHTSAPYTCELCFRNTSGEQKQVRLELSVCLDDERHVLAMFIDLTEQQRQQRERELQLQQIWAQKHMESLKSMAAGVAHEFNNALAVMMGNAELALVELAPEHPARPSLGVVRNTAQHAAQFVDQLLCSAGHLDVRLQPCSLNDMAAALQAFIPGAIDSATRLITHSCTEDIVVSADIAHLYCALNNIMHNAAEALDDSRGTITLQTGTALLQAEELARCQGGTARPGLFGFISVADDGCGMDERTVARVFEPFFSTKFIGRGLGLTMVQALMCRHSGAIQIASHPGRGTTVTLYLPVAMPFTTGDRAGCVPHV